MLIQLDMTMDQYVKGVHSTVSHPKFFSKRSPCEIRINNYIHDFLHIWRANHDIQSTIFKSTCNDQIYIIMSQKVKCARAQSINQHVDTGQLNVPP